MAGTQKCPSLNTVTQTRHHNLGVGLEWDRSIAAATPHLDWNPDIAQPFAPKREAKAWGCNNGCPNAAIAGELAGASWVCQQGRPNVLEHLTNELRLPQAVFCDPRHVWLPSNQAEHGEGARREAKGAHSF